jgi:plastocyanin
MNKTIVAIIAVIILAVAGGTLALMSGDSDTKKPESGSATSSTSSTTTDNSTQTTTPAGDSTAAANTITYTNDGFKPSSLTVKAGSKVTVKNDASGSLQFDSDPHPEHTEDPEINIGLISPGSSQTITVTKTGSHGYHNHLNSGDTGMLIVE